MSIRFDVPGRPVPQGSLRAFKAKSGAIVTPQQPKVLSWRGSVQSAYLRAADARPARSPEPSDAAFYVAVEFYFKRPKAHLTSKGLAKASAPLAHTQSPDVDKLLRSILDALTGYVWHDDKQVVTVHGDKSWSDRDYASIQIVPLEDPE